MKYFHKSIRLPKILMIKIKIYAKSPNLSKKAKKYIMQKKFLIKNILSKPILWILYPVKVIIKVIIHSIIVFLIYLLNMQARQLTHLKQKEEITLVLIKYNQHPKLLILNSYIGLNLKETHTNNSVLIPIFLLVKRMEIILRHYIQTIKITEIVFIVIDIYLYKTYLHKLIWDQKFYRSIMKIQFKTEIRLQ